MVFFSIGDLLQNTVQLPSFLYFNEEVRIKQTLFHKMTVKQGHIHTQSFDTLLDESSGAQLSLSSLSAYDGDHKSETFSQYYFHDI